jgi:hypothetical protein
MHKFLGNNMQDSKSPSNAFYFSATCSIVMHRSRAWPVSAVQRTRLSSAGGGGGCACEASGAEAPLRDE